MKKARRWLALALTLALCLGLLAGCKDNGTPGNGDVDGTPDPNATYTYNTYITSTPTTWNSHDVQVTEGITQYTEISLWQLVLNDTADGYVFSNELAAAEPEDVTAEYAGDAKWGIPDGATEGYAWRITLNPDAKWQDGTPINADSYVYSAQQVLSPEMNNLNASGLFTRLPVANAENYCKFSDGIIKTPVVDGETYEFADTGDSQVYISFTQANAGMWGDSAESWYNSGYAEYFYNEAGEDLMEKYGGQDYVPVTDEVIADVNYFLEVFGSYDPDSWQYMAYYDVQGEPTTWEDVGFLKTGDYELTIILTTPMSPYNFKYNSGSLYLVNEEKYEAGKQASGDMIKTNYGTSVDTYMAYGPYKLVSFQADKEYRLTRNENWYGWTDGKHDGLYQTTDIVVTVVEDTATQEQLFLQGKLDILSLNADAMKTYLGSDYLAYSGDAILDFLNINNEYDLLAERQEPGINKTILTYLDFRKGISLAVNRSEYTAQRGGSQPMYGYLSNYYVADVETGQRYRDTEAAQETLKTFYGVNDVDEITGYDLDTARACLVSGYEQALADGEVSETDKFVFDYPVFTGNASDLRTISFLQTAMDNATEGTALEGRITINMVVSEGYYDLLDSGEYDICLSNWNGVASDPFYQMYYFVTDEVSPQAYFGFDGQSETLDIEIDGTVVTKTYYDWFEELYYGEYAIADTDVRVQILAAMELGLLQMYRDCPFWCPSYAQLLSMKIAYPTYEEILNLDLGGGIRNMTYNYTDTQWADFCAANNNQLNYN